MFFQQWSKSGFTCSSNIVHAWTAGVNAILYYAPSIFQALSLTGNTISLLATGVVGIAYDEGLL